MNLIKPATVLAPYGVLMHEKWYFNWIQYGRQAYVFVYPQHFAISGPSSYLENLLTIQHEILIEYWYPCKDVSFQIWRRSEIHYGRHGAIFDFLDTISQEPFEQSL